MNSAPIHWLFDFLIVIGGINLFVAIWFCVGWYNNTRKPKLSEREQFLADNARRAMKRAV